MFWVCALVFASWQPHDFVSASQQRELELKKQKVPEQEAQHRAGTKDRHVWFVRPRCSHEATQLLRGSFHSCSRRQDLCDQESPIRPMFCPCSLEGQLKSSCCRNKQLRFGCWQLSVLPVMDDKGGLCLILSSPSAHFQSQDIFLKIHPPPFSLSFFLSSFCFLEKKNPAVLPGSCACWVIMLCLVDLPKLPGRFGIMGKMYFLWSLPRSIQDFGFLSHERKI